MRVEVCCLGTDQLGFTHPVKKLSLESSCNPSEAIYESIRAICESIRAVWSKFE
jgi:hypothetical protein